MAYCNKCGAYIPDGQTKCLACGYDEVEQQAAAAAAAQCEPKESGRLDSDFLRRQLEQQRQRQRDSSKKWAEAERARRQQQQSSAQKAAQKEAHADSTADFGNTDTAGAGVAGKVASALSNKTLAALSYLGPLCFLPMFLCPNDEFASFHARQGLGLLILGVAGNILSAIIGMSWLVSAAWIYMIYMGMTTASAGKMNPLPYIGNLFQKK